MQQVGTTRPRDEYSHSGLWYICVARPNVSGRSAAKNADGSAGAGGFAMSTALSEAVRFDTPALEHVLSVYAAIGAPVSMGRTPQGQRRVIPISGGTFEGRDMQGIILPGGEDWQLVRDDGVTELDARYWLLTEDEVVIRVHNRALVVPPTPAGTKVPVRSSVTLEAPLGKYDWLNKAVCVGTLSVDRARQPAVVMLRFYQVV
jgi:hypothetical protein